MKYLHTMVRVTDIEKSLAFYRDALGLQLLSRKDSEAGKFTLVFLAAPGDTSAQVELTYNWPAADGQAEVYTGGRNFGDRKSTRLNSSHLRLSRMPSSA